VAVLRRGLAKEKRLRRIIHKMALRMARKRREPTFKIKMTNLYDTDVGGMGFFREKSAKK